jgi:hypothetical protein
MYKFEFRNPNTNKVIFESNLYEGQCAICKSLTTIPFDYCEACALSHLHLRIGLSTIPNSGLGLSAYDESKPNDAVIFKSNEKIIEYNGEITHDEEMDIRYEGFTAPYAVKLNSKKRENIDSALMRGIASLINSNGLTLKNNNCKLSYVAKTNSINIKAIKNIHNNEELNLLYNDVNYNFTHPHRTIRIEEEKPKEVAIDLTEDNEEYEPMMPKINKSLITKKDDVGRDIIIVDTDDENEEEELDTMNYFDSNGKKLSRNSKLKKLIYNLQLNNKVEVRLSNIPDAGNGLFVKAHNQIMRNDIICTYGGYCYSKKEVEENDLEIYAVELHDGTGRICVGDDFTGDLGMRINGKKPNDNLCVNCKFATDKSLYYYTTNNKLRVRFPIYANRNLVEQEEIITNYGKSYWKTISNKY